YLTEPHVVSRSWQLDPTAQLPPVPDPCLPDADLPSLAATGTVPHYLPGKNPSVNDVTRMYHIPVEAVMGGAETIYPQYRKKLKAGYIAPPICVRYCWPLPGCIMGGDPKAPDKPF